MTPPLITFSPLSPLQQHGNVQDRESPAHERSPAVQEEHRLAVATTNGRQVMRRFVYEYRNPHTGTVKGKMIMGTPDASLNNGILQKNGKRYRWQRKIGKRYFTP